MVYSVTRYNALCSTGNLSEGELFRAANVAAHQRLRRKLRRFPNDLDCWLACEMARVLAGLKRPTCESCLVIDVRHWEREGLLRAGRSFSCTWSRNGTLTARVDVDVTVDAVLLSFVWRQTGTSELKRDCQCVPLTWTALHPLSPHCRGIRPWFLCPKIDGDGQPCGRRVALLYSGRNPYFACRKCQRLAYAIEQEGPCDRKLRRARKARLRLGASLSLRDPLPPRPKGMHRATYSQLSGKAIIAAERWFGQLALYLDRRRSGAGSCGTLAAFRVRGAPRRQRLYGPTSP